MSKTRTSVIIAASGLALAATWAQAQSEPFPAVLELADLDGSNGFRMVGSVPREAFGGAVGSVGDFNGDGFAGGVIGAKGLRYSGSGGGAYIVFGRDSFPPTVAVAGLSGDDGLYIEGAGPVTESGFAVGGGDFNHDGIGDAIITARLADVGTLINAGEAYVVFGRDVAGGGEPFGPTFRVADVNGENGFRVTGADRSNILGTAASSAGDVNGDGIEDLLLGAPYAYEVEGYGRGGAYVVYGRDVPGGAAFPASIGVASLDPSTGFAMMGEEPTDNAGRKVAAAGDVNGDGLGDVIVGVEDRYYGHGGAYVVYGQEGRPAGLIELADLDGSDGFEAAPPEFEHGACGRGIAGLGDINGDGVDDFAISTPAVSVSGGPDVEGITRVVFGRAGGFPAEFDLGGLDGTNGFRLEGELELDASGWSVAAADLNGDGVNDLVIGAPYGQGARPWAGRVYVVFGRRDGDYPPVVALGELGGVDGFRIDAVDAYDGAGRSVANAGDVNGDGVEDVIIGTTAREAGAGEEAYVVFGRALGCPADLDADGDLTIFDFLAFQNLFDVMDPRADFDGDGDFTIFDFLEFQNAFDAGCP